MKLPSDQNLAELESAVRTRVGFDPQSIGEQSLIRALCQRMTERHTSDGNDYTTRLLTDDAEFDALIEELLVPETWFFRDRQPFRCVQHFATRCWRPSRLGDRLRVLSIPCSTGEEPYSIAMALLDVGLLRSQFEIDGVDLSRRSLRRAEDAVFTKSSFRGDEAVFPGLCDRFLDRRGEHYVANADLREAVRFSQANLVSPSLLADQPEYQIVFCRNVLIYLDAEARRGALANLYRLLSPDGLLYVGHVEARVVADGRFCRFSDEFPFAFSPTSGDDDPNTEHQPATSAPFRPSSPAGSTLRSSTKNTATAARLQPGKRALSANVASPSASRAQCAVTTKPVERETKLPDVPTTLAAARFAANAGRLDEASRLCEEILEREPTSEEVYLLGIVSEVRGDKGQAERFYQKALYLEPRHKEALVHMMLLAQERGDDNSAANFRRRVEQIQEVGG